MVVYTKDKLIEELVCMNRRSVEALNGVKNALKLINDFNILHTSKEDTRYSTIKSLVDSNNKTYRLFSIVVIVLIAAIIILAGAEKALKFMPVL